MPIAFDISNHVYGRLTPLCPFGRNKHGQPQWICACECGNEKVLSTNVLRQGTVKSCGCIFSDYKRRFWNKVTKKGPILVPRLGKCWLWTGSKISKTRPYGRMNAKGKAVLTHRLSWEITYGSLLDKEDILHKCDNPPCVRPSHLLKGDAFSNMRDMVSKGRNVVPSRKLNVSQVKEIRRLSEEGASSRKLANQFNISKSQINQIVNRVYWTSI